MSVLFDRRALVKSVKEKGGNITEPDEDGKQGTEQAPSEDHAKLSEAHGPATSTHIDYDSSGAHITSTFSDGYEHKGTELDRERAFGIARQHAGLDEIPAQSQQESMKAKAHPTGPKEKQRIDQEDGRIPGYER